MGKRFRFVTAVLVVAAARQFFTSVQVRGDSMWPTMNHGDLWLALRRGRARPGRIALMRKPHGQPGPGEPMMVKRIAAVNPGVVDIDVDVKGTTVRLPGLTVWAVGDNPGGSIDSSVLGPIPVSDVVAYPVVRISRGQSPQNPTNLVPPQ